MSNPRVYVGTYGKYNRGSLGGGWLSLMDCKDYQDFLRRCGRLHRGERDPEFMIQDTEDFPDGLDCGEWLSEQDFNDIRQAVSEGDDYLNDDGGGLDAMIAAAAAILRDDTPPLPLPSKGRGAATAQKADDKALLEEYMAEIRKAYEGDTSMLDYHRKRFSGAVRLENGGIVVFEKPSIDTAFCFHDEGPDYELYEDVTKTKDTLRDYFLSRNLGPMTRETEALEKNCRSDEGDYQPGYYCKDWYLYRVSYSSQKEPLNVWKYVALSHMDSEQHASWYKDLQPMGDADRRAIAEGMRREREKFDKRLQTYLKRYGTSKIRTWTYWADA